MTTTSTSLGIELGSTRIKAVLVDQNGAVLGSGAHDWENEYINNNWTYSLDDVWNGLRDCIAKLASDAQQRSGTSLDSVDALGISAMMHGYLVFDAAGELLTPFRTWRNTNTTTAAALLTDTLQQNIPLRWSVSHLLHSVLGAEEHVPHINFLTTLAGYVHWKLTGRRVLGVGDASGVFPIDTTTGTYDTAKIDAFNHLKAVSKVPWKISDLLPEVLPAGADAGTLTAEGAALLDPTGTLRPGIRLVPPEGDAGTGMVATNSIRPGTGNVSAGTSAFAMVVLDHGLTGIRPEIDLVTTPCGDPVAMIHTNNCTGDLDAWLRLFEQFAQLINAPVDETHLYQALFDTAMTGPSDAAGLLSYNYLSGEHQTGVEAGRPLFVRGQSAEFTLASFMRTQIYAAFAALACGMHVLLDEEHVRLDKLFAHGGIFRTRHVAQQILADALNTPITVGETAGEGGAWGMAVLAAYGNQHDHTTLPNYVDQAIFATNNTDTLDPTPDGAAGYAAWLKRYQSALPVERLAGTTVD